MNHNNNNKKRKTKIVKRKVLKKKKTAKLNRNKIILKSSENLFLFIDIETTGFPERNSNIYNHYYHFSDTEKYDSSRIVQIAWVIFNYKQVKKGENNFIIRPNNFVIENSHIHNITQDYAVKNGVDISIALNALQNDLKNIGFIVGHSLEFILNILFSEMHRLNMNDSINEILKKKHICTAEQMKTIVKIPGTLNNYKIPKFDELFEYCFNRNPTKRHDAINDAIDLSNCFFHIMKNVIQ